MKLFRGFQQISELSAGTAVTIGNFDGVHRGHQALLSMLRSQADRMHLPVLVMLFEPQPSEYFHNQQAPARLSSFREKVDALSRLGVDYVYCVKFDRKIASMAAVEFAERIVFSLLHANYLLIGEDFRFGKGRLVDVSLLNVIGNQTSCVVEHFQDFTVDAQRVSSTDIRRALQLGDFQQVAKLLGRPYSLCGRVIRGDARGRQWGVPTANLSLHRCTLPLKGVFCVQVMRQGKPWVMGVANMGCRPTVDGSKQVLEVHLFDVNESLYGEMLQVCFLHKLRDEVKFSSLDALIAQIHKDVAAARNWFVRNTSAPELPVRLNNCSSSPSSVTA